MNQRSTDVMKKMQYLLNSRAVINKEAFFSDGSINYRIPAEPQAGEMLTIRFRTQRNNVDAVFLIVGDQRYEMEIYKSANGFDYYHVQVQMPDKILRYHFEILYGWVKCYYSYQGVSMDAEDCIDFEVYPGYETPDWAKGAVMYQIYTDRFYNGDPTNDVVTCEYAYIGDVSQRVTDWDKIPAVMGVREFYGGDLQGIMDKLDYLQDLGVDVLYLNPIFVSPSNHKYDSQDYDNVDPHIGKIIEDSDIILWHGDKTNAHAKKYITRVSSKVNLDASNQLLADLCEEIHKRGMKIILDGVFNHCGSFNKWMDRERIYEGQEGYAPGAFISADSPYRKYFKFHEDRWPYNTSYDGWWAHDTLPKLNYEESPELYEYIMNVGRRWVSPPYNADGWRLDVAADLGHTNEFNHKFWKDFRKAVKEANPNAIILAEHYGNPEKWLLGDEWDTVMNYDAFMEPITWFLTGMEKHSDEKRDDLYGNSEAFIGAMRNHMRSLHMSALYTAMNELSNHDHSRFLTRTNRRVGRISSAGGAAASEGINVAVMREAVAMQMTWPGAPTIYYGDEAGVCGFTDPDSRRTYPWGHEDQDLIAFHKAMIRIHKDYKILNDGSLKFLWNDYQGLCYGRFSYDEQIIVLVNNKDVARDAEINVWQTGISRLENSDLQRIMLTHKDGFTTEPATVHAVAGVIKAHMPANSVTVLYHKNNE
ncbi:MAG: glycoside hydrolase family 13 protein [Clostridiales bacterium]|nr:glycoside hydrolase family 13 protein [Candidatus Blautia equi]